MVRRTYHDTMKPSGHEFDPRESVRPLGPRLGVVSFKDLELVAVSLGTDFFSFARYAILKDYFRAGCPQECRKEH